MKGHSGINHRSRVKCQLSTYGFFPRLLLLRNTAWTLNLDQKVGCRQGYKYLKSRGAADKNMSAMAILAYNCKCHGSYQQSVHIIGTPYAFNTINYRHLELYHHSACNPRERKLYKNQWCRQGGCMWVHLHPIYAPVHPSYACVVLLLTYM